MIQNKLKAQNSKFKTLSVLVVIMLFFVGCAPQMRKSAKVCPGAASVEDALSALKTNYKNAVSWRGNGRCIYFNGKDKQNFAVKIWVSPPINIYLQGDVGFDPKGIVLGSNADEFWLSIRHKDISSYWWGRWSQQNSLGLLKINPRILLEAFGLIVADSEKNWSLSNQAHLMC